jgi:hypothetical protein
MVAGSKPGGTKHRSGGCRFKTGRYKTQEWWLDEVFGNALRTNERRTYDLVRSIYTQGRSANSAGLG